METWKCKVGLHNWQQVCGKLDFEIENEELRKIYKSCPTGVKEHTLGVFVEKICLDCGKYVDEITPIREEIRKRLLEKKSRYERAKELLKERAR